MLHYRGRQFIDCVQGERRFSSAQYRARLDSRLLKRVVVEKQLETGVLKLARSGWLAPDLFATQKDVHLRFRIFCKLVNDMKLKEAYPLPRIDDVLIHLMIDGASVLTTLDANTRYFQSSVLREACEKTSVFHQWRVFDTHRCLLCWRMRWKQYTAYFWS